MNADSLPPVLTAAQVADLFQVSKRYVYKLAETGELPGLRLGSALRFRRDVVVRLLDGSVPITGPDIESALPGDGSRGDVRESPAGASSSPAGERLGQRHGQRRPRSTS